MKNPNKKKRLLYNSFIIDIMISDMYKKEKGCFPSSFI